MKRGAKIVLITALSLGLTASSVLLLNSKRIFAEEDSKIDYSLELVNTERSKNGLAKLNWNDDLAKAAQKKAEDIFAKNYFDHTSPDGKKAWDFILTSGYDYRIAGENLAVDYDNVNDAFIGWENSPSHLANILSDNYSDYALVEKEGNLDGKTTIVYVQLFAVK